jgi:hypothetical protein
MRRILPLAGLAPAFLASLAAAAAAAPVLPDFAAATFTPGAAVDNPYFPLVAGSRTVTEARYVEDGETVVERSELEVLGPGPTILGVQATVRRDRAYEDGLLVEDTFDYYAQDTVGNVWYLGEDVVNYHYDDDGVLIGTDNASAWIGGVGGALPGFIMPAAPIIGFNYYQEFAAADAALDQATILSIGETATFGSWTFENVLRVVETTELDPDVREAKLYAPGVGVIAALEGLDETFGNPQVVFEPVTITAGPAPVPAPAAGWLLAAALGWVFAFRRRGARVLRPVVTGVCA